MRGKTYEEIYGRERAEQIKAKVSKNHANVWGENNAFFGKCHTEKTKELIKDYNLGKTYSDEVNKKKGTHGPNHPSKRPEVRRKISLAAIRNKVGEKGQRALAGNRALDTWIEKRVRTFLLDLGFKEGEDFKIKAYVRTKKTFRFPDFLLPKHKLIIECDGERWHNITEDLERDKEFHDLGFKVLHLTGKVIRNYYPLRQLIGSEIQAFPNEPEKSKFVRLTTDATISVESDLKCGMKLLSL